MPTSLSVSASVSIFLSLSHCLPSSPLPPFPSRIKARAQDVLPARTPPPLASTVTPSVPCARSARTSRQRGQLLAASARTVTRVALETSKARLQCRSAESARWESTISRLESATASTARLVALKTSLARQLVIRRGEWIGSASTSALVWPALTPFPPAPPVPTPPQCCISSAGFWSPDGAGSCIICPPGKYGSPGAGIPLSSCSGNCGPGTFSGAGAQSCSNCTEGRFSNNAANSECEVCPAGRVQSRQGQRECDKVCKFGGRRCTYATHTTLTQPMTLHQATPGPTPRRARVSATHAPLEPSDWLEHPLQAIRARERAALEPFPAEPPLSAQP